MNEKAQILVRDVPKKVVEKLDEIAKSEGYMSRNQMLVDLLERYSMVKNEIYYETLAPITKTAFRTEIENFNELSTATVHTIALAAEKLLKVAQRLDEYLVDDETAKAEYRAIDELVDEIRSENQ